MGNKQKSIGGEYIKHLLCERHQLSFTESKTLYEQYTDLLLRCGSNVTNRRNKRQRGVDKVIMKADVLYHGVIGHYKGPIYACQFLGIDEPYVFFKCVIPSFHQSITNLCFYIKPNNRGDEDVLFLTLVQNNSTSPIQWIFDITI